MKARLSTIVMFLAGLSVAGAVYAADPAPSSPSISAPAKIDRAVAEKTALARVPGGIIKEGELEKEHGHTVWSFDIAQPTSADITEVQVDAMTGRVISVSRETPADQAKEAAEDKGKVSTKP